MDAAGYRMMEALFGAIGTPAKFSPLTIDGTAKTLVSHLVGGFPGFTSPHRLRPGEAGRSTSGSTRWSPTATTSPCSDPVTVHPGRQGPRRGVGPRPAADRDGPAGHPPPRAPSGHRLTPCSPSSSGSCCATEPTSRCSPTRPPAGTSWPGPSSRSRLGHAADLAGLTEDELTALLASVRAAGRWPSTPGPASPCRPSTATSPQWLAWVLMILTGAMNRPGGVWFHPGFNQQFDSFELPVLDPDIIFGPGPPSRPEAQAFLGEWPCAALPDEIAAGNIRAVLNLGGSLAHLVPRRQRPGARAASSSTCSSPPRSSPTTPPPCPPTSCPPRTSSSGPT